MLKVFSNQTLRGKSDLLIIHGFNFCYNFFINGHNIGYQHYKVCAMIQMNVQNFDINF